MFKKYFLPAAALLILLWLSACGAGSPSSVAEAIGTSQPEVTATAPVEIAEAQPGKTVATPKATPEATVAPTAEPSVDPTAEPSNEPQEVNPDEIPGLWVMTTLEVNDVPFTIELLNVFMETDDPTGCYILFKDNGTVYLNLFGEASWSSWYKTDTDIYVDDDTFSREADYLCLASDGIALCWKKISNSQELPDDTDFMYNPNGKDGLATISETPQIPEEGDLTGAWEISLIKKNGYYLTVDQLNILSDTDFYGQMILQSEGTVYLELAGQHGVSLWSASGTSVNVGDESMTYIGDFIRMEDTDDELTIYWAKESDSQTIPTSNNRSTAAATPACPVEESDYATDLKFKLIGAETTVSLEFQEELLDRKFDYIFSDSDIDTSKMSVDVAYDEDSLEYSAPEYDEENDLWTIYAYEAFTVYETYEGKIVSTQTGRLTVNIIYNQSGSSVGGGYIGYELDN